MEEWNGWLDKHVDTAEYNENNEFFDTDSPYHKHCQEVAKAMRAVDPKAIDAGSRLSKDIKYIEVGQLG